MLLQKVRSLTDFLNLDIPEVRELHVDGLEPQKYFWIVKDVYMDQQLRIFTNAKNPTDTREESINDFKCFQEKIKKWMETGEI